MNIPLRTLVIWTLTVMVFLIGVAAILNHQQTPKGIALETEGQPTIGYAKAKVHVIVFEEPKCSNCKIYNEAISPLIKKNFIDTNKIRYTVIPVSFLPNSMPAVVALLSAYYQDARYPNSELFFTFLDYLYANQPNEYINWATPSTLLEMARKATPEINLVQLQQAIETDKYRKVAIENTEYGKSIMEGSIATPSIYVDGVAAEDLSYSAIREMIEKALKHKGVL